MHSSPPKLINFVGGSGTTQMDSSCEKVKKQDSQEDF